MRAVTQRVSSASITVDGAIIATIGAGLLVLVGVENGDTEPDAMWLARKIATLRVFPDAEGKMNFSLLPSTVAEAPTCELRDVLVVSQFTLLASTRNGTRPSFNDAARPEIAVPQYEAFVRNLEETLGRTVRTGRFGADMKVALVNDGPVTLVIDSRIRE